LSDARRHQVVEIPPAAAAVTEYVLHHEQCAACGHTTAADLPEGVPPWAIGPRFQATLSTLTGRFRLSRRETLEAAVALFGPKARLSLGTLTSMEARTRTALSSAYEEAAAAVHGSRVVHPDETSYYERKHKSWLWVAATPAVAYFRIDPQRGRSAFERLLPDFAGIIVVDRWKAYLRHAHRKRQLCWAHLKRNFQELVDRGYPATLVGRPGLRAADAVFSAWEDHEEGRLSRRGLGRRLSAQRKFLGRALTRGLGNADPKVRAKAKDLLPQVECLWTFTRRTGVTPHNNLAERLLRLAVLWRKGSFGTQSAGGSRFAETMLTVVQTLRLQKRAVMDFVEQSIRAARLGIAPPRLLTP
jgi:transposase